MRAPCTIANSVSQDSLRRFSLFKWVLLGLMSLLLAILLSPYGWHSNAGIGQAVLDTSSVALTTLQFDELTPVDAGEGLMGTVSLAGSGQPGSIVALLQDGVTFGGTMIDETGNWSYHGLIRLLPGQHHFQARMVGTDQTAMSQSNLISVLIPDVKASAQTSLQVDPIELKPEDHERETVESQLQTDGRHPSTLVDAVTGQEKKSPTVGETVVGDRKMRDVGHETAGSKPQTNGRRQVAIDRNSPTSDVERGKDALAILGTNRDATGNPLPGFFGRANPNTTLEIVKGQTVLGRIQVRADGTWRCKCKLPPGDHILRVRELGRPDVISQPKILTVSNLAPPMILPQASVIRPVRPVSCPDALPSGEIRGDLYVVGRCETLMYIARRLGTDLSSLISYNPQVSDVNRIYAGQILNIPTTAACLTEDA
ncbi:MAG: hypothetical protein ETSY1_34475 [Candidatus Entotheonella factor]|uniref:LysM domain-containing protein n=1 Tax=Entotheonella factor TaxID=1429438 RepID=W4L8V0_ENTF1|nr:MAG: hypothetical protein ETSY1_34475 [Candidatus Entotheonella factor]